MAKKVFANQLVTIFLIIRSAYYCESYCLSKIAAGLRHPMTAIQLPGRSGCILVAEHRGLTKVLCRDVGDTMRDYMFLDITDRVFTTAEPGDERGLLSLVAAPNFPDENHVYLCYSAPAKAPDEDHRTVVSRFDVNDENNQYMKASVDSELVILEISQPGPRYNGGQLLFGPDGFLYIATGEGGDGKDDRFNLSSLLGKVLRIDVRGSGARHYRIPADNPFQGQSSRPEIFAYGFRNPWRCTFYSTPRFKKLNYLTGLLCGDTGVEPHRVEEEVYLVQPGKRYGWMDLEHSPCRSVNACSEIEPNIRADDALPVFTYARSDGQAIVGGIVYTGDSMPELRGKYLYADFVHGSLHTLQPHESVTPWVSEDLPIQFCSEARSTPFFILSIAEDRKGEPLVMTTTDLSNESPQGVIYRLSPHSFMATATAGSGARKYEAAIYHLHLLFFTVNILNARKLI
ncbi:HHIP-like protein 2 [Ornithodoros turicata]|uniref:HHIP-like protein 2 n=1 Tax=Ornithodoros turicata TaxID=34597 RepID=UPI003139F020